MYSRFMLKINKLNIREDNKSNVTEKQQTARSF